MNPILGGLLSGGASLLGSIFSSDTSAKNTEEQIAASKEQQATQNAFAEQMSNTAYQRSSADMKAAGLNPMMMFGSGSAASSPTGSSIQAPMPQTTSAGAGLGRAADSVVNTAIQAKTFDKMTQEISNLRADEAKRAAETITEKERPALVKEQVLNTAADTARRQNEMPESRVRGLSAAAIESMPAWLRDTAVRGGFLGGKVSDAIAPIISSATSVGRISKSVADETFRNRFHFGE